MDCKRQKEEKQMSGKIQMLLSIVYIPFLLPFEEWRIYFPICWEHCKQTSLSAQTPLGIPSVKGNHPAKHHTPFPGWPASSFLPQLGRSLKGQAIFRPPWSTEAFCRLHCPLIFPQSNPASFPLLFHRLSQGHPPTDLLHNNLHFGVSHREPKPWTFSFASLYRTVKLFFELQNSARTDVIIALWQSRSPVACSCLEELLLHWHQYYILPQGTKSRKNNGNSYGKC